MVGMETHLTCHIDVIEDSESSLAGWRWTQDPSVLGELAIRETASGADGKQRPGSRLGR